MTEASLHPIWGVVITLAGLALAVLAGSVLYRDKDEKKQAVSSKKTFKIHEARPAKESEY